MQEVPEPADSDQTPLPGLVKTPPLTVKTTDGKTCTEDLLPSKGSPQDLMTQQELEDKFTGLTTRVLPRDQAAQIAAAVKNLEEVKDLRDLADLLVSASSRTPDARSAALPGHQTCSACQVEARRSRSALGNFLPATGSAKCRIDGGLPTMRLLCRLPACPDRRGSGTSRPRPLASPVALMSAAAPERMVTPASAPDWQARPVPG